MSARGAGSNADGVSSLQLLRFIRYLEQKVGPETQNVTNLRIILANCGCLGDSPGSLTMMVFRRTMRRLMEERLIKARDPGAQDSWFDITEKGNQKLQALS
jgi:hypothetical protein